MSKQTRPPKSATLTAQLRWYLKNSETSTYEISRRIGISHASLYKFLAGSHGLLGDTMDRLAKFLRLRLVQDRK